MRLWLLLALLVMSAGCISAQNVRVTGEVAIERNGKPIPNQSGAVVWLAPTKGEAAKPAADKVFRLTQKNKHFEPHLLVVPINSAVLFPNQDPFFHNVFSVYEGTRFDLGLYESGTSREVHFNRPGPSYIFCNIHPEMSAIIMVMTTPYYATTDEHGNYAIEGVPPGEYDFNVWYESAQPDELKQLRHRTVVSLPTTHLSATAIKAAPSLAVNHKNKYGQDYEGKAPYSFPQSN